MLTLEVNHSAAHATFYRILINCVISRQLAIEQFNEVFNDLICSLCRVVRVF